MVFAVFQPDFPQPLGGFLSGLPLRFAAHQKRHGHILLRSELRQQIVKLPDKTYLAIAKFRTRIVRQFPYWNLGAVYVTCGSPIKSPENVEQTAFART